MPKVNFNPQGTLIQDEALFVPPQSHITGTKFKLSHDVFSSVDFSITYNGEALVPQVDYVLTDVYERARQEMGLTVYQRVQFLPNAPLGFAGTVYVTYRAVGDFVDANEITNQTDNDGRYLKQIYNLSDIASPQSALKNLESAASETTDPEDFGYDDANEESFSDVMVQTNWGDGIPMKVPFKEFADETARAAIPNPLPVSEGGTNAQSIDGAISNILSEATSVDDDAVRDDGAVPFQCPSAYQHQNVGKITLLQIFNNWLKSKLQSWLGITVTESGGSITGRTFDGNATTAAKTSNAITFSNSGDGAASGSTFDGSAARKLSYNSIGAAAVSHKHVVTDVSDLYLNYPAPTYIISTQAEFNNWVNNTSGNDYSSVLILGGITYTTTKSIDCALTGTSFIRGEFNPVISFTPPNPPQNTKLFNGNKATIMNVIINFSVADTGTVYSHYYSVLFNFHGVFNVTLSGTSLLNSGHDSSWGNMNITVVNGCRRVYNCDATIDGSVSSSGYYGTITVYNQCNELINCIGKGITHGQGSGNTYNRCYYKNNYMRNCTGSLSGNGNNKVFDSNTNQR